MCARWNNKKKNVHSFDSRSLHSGTEEWWVDLPLSTLTLGFDNYGLGWSPSLHLGPSTTVSTFLFIEVSPGLSLLFREVGLSDRFVLPSVLLSFTSHTVPGGTGSSLCGRSSLPPAVGSGECGFRRTPRGDKVLYEGRFGCGCSVLPRGLPPHCTSHCGTVHDCRLVVESRYDLYVSGRPSVYFFV